MASSHMICVGVDSVLAGTVTQDTSQSSSSVIKQMIDDVEQSWFSSRFLVSQNVFDALEHKIELLKDVPPNWNSYDSPSPSVESRERSKAVLRALRTKLLEPERVLASAEGGVAFTFVSNTSSRAAIEVLNNGEEYVFLYDLSGQARTIDWPKSFEDAANLVAND